jgi:hypothetical protein
MTCILMSFLLAGDLPRTLAEEIPKALDQEAQEDDWPQPERLSAPERPFKPRYELGPSARLSLHFLRPRVSYDTREYNPGVFSGEVELSERADLPGFAPAGALRLDLRALRVDFGFLHMSSRSELDRPLSYEEETFQPGESVSVLAQAGWLDLAYRWSLVGDERSRASLWALIGLHAPRVKITVENDRASAREGFSALWPVPSAGLEATCWLTDRVRLRGSLIGTRLRFTNPFKEDAGEPQDLAYLYLRWEAGLAIDLSARWALHAGYSRLLMDVTASSPKDDKDRAVFEADGLYVGIELRF